MRVGIEVGGTFTDLVAVDRGQVRVVKVPSTPHSPDIGAFNAFGATGLEPGVVTDLVHGSTVATNAILERKGAPIAFITTAGFRDILFLQRHDRRNIYDLKYKKPVPPVRRKDCFEITERIDAHGDVLIPVSESEIRERLLPELRGGNYRAIAICLISSYASPVHELLLKSHLERLLPDVHITCSHEVAAEFREFERASTAALSAYVQPVISRYLDRFENTLREAGFHGNFSVMQSNGGRIPAVAMRRNAITALLSGPAAGVVGAIRQARRSDRVNLITFDMGGTSTDVSLVQNGEASLAPETEVDGLPIRTPVLDIVTVGAGGGSLVWIDDGGMLRVGPRSAGAEPGPACYGRGGALPTITDAHVVRGTIRPDAFLGGAMTLDAEAAHRAFADIAARLGMTVREAAAAAIKLAVANIVRAIQLVSTERGRDPRSYTLLPFGGAGPLLAAEIADDLGLREILVPPNPGVISALGLLSADYVKVQGVTRRHPLNGEAPGMLRSAFLQFQSQAKREFDMLGLDGALDYTLEANMRFIGQAFEIPVALDPLTLTSLKETDLAARFAEEHQRVYLHGGEPGRKAELVSLRFGVRRRLDQFPEVYERSSDIHRAATTEVAVGARIVSARIQDAARLAPGESLAGPAMIEGYSSTIWLPPGWRAVRDQAANILLQREI